MMDAKLIEDYIEEKLTELTEREVACWDLIRDAAIRRDERVVRNLLDQVLRTVHNETLNMHGLRIMLNTYWKDGRTLTRQNAEWKVVEKPNWKEKFPTLYEGVIPKHTPTEEGKEHGI